MSSLALALHLYMEWVLDSNVNIILLTVVLCLSCYVQGSFSPAIRGAYGCDQSPQQRYTNIFITFSAGIRSRESRRIPPCTFISQPSRFRPHPAWCYRLIRLFIGPRSSGRKGDCILPGSITGGIKQCAAGSIALKHSTCTTHNYPYALCSP